MVVPSYGSVVCICHASGGGDEHPHLREVVPAHATAGGRALLAYREPWAASILAAPLERHTSDTVVLARALAVNLEKVRDRGHAVEDGEYSRACARSACPSWWAARRSRRCRSPARGLRSTTRSRTSSRPRGSSDWTWPVATQADIAGALDRLVVAAHRQRAATAATMDDLNAIDLLALTIVYRVGAITPGALARAMGFSSSGTSTVIRRVADATMIDRTTSPSDPHDVRLTPTQRGIG